MKAQENDQGIKYAALGTHQEAKIIKGSRGDACVQLKTNTTTFLPVLQGTKESVLFIIFDEECLERA